MSVYELSELQIERGCLQQVSVNKRQMDSDNLKAGQVLLKVLSFGFSANNITYGLLGEKMGYWGFFSNQETTGRLPVWGFAQVITSCCKGVKVGEKVYGYLPMASHVIVEPGKINDFGFSDTAPWRKSISPVYDQYVRCATDPGYQADTEVLQLNFRPLFMTAFVLNQYVQDNQGKQNCQVIITSASSKTALGTAYLLKSRLQSDDNTIEVVGLTSPSNLEFVKKLGCYDQVLSYQDVASLPKSLPGWVLDFAGNKATLLTLQSHLADTLAKMLFIGVTDVISQTAATSGHLNGEVFFAPAQVSLLNARWGQAEFAKRYANAWGGFITKIQSHLSVKTVIGAEEIKALYLQGLEGKLHTTQMIEARFD